MVDRRRGAPQRCRCAAAQRSVARPRGETERSSPRRVQSTSVGRGSRRPCVGPTDITVGGGAFPSDLLVQHAEAGHCAVWSWLGRLGHGARGRAAPAAPRPHTPCCRFFWLGLGPEVPAHQQRRGVDDEGQPPIGKQAGSAGGQASKTRASTLRFCCNGASPPFFFFFGKCDAEFVQKTTHVCAPSFFNNGVQWRAGALSHFESSEIPAEPFVRTAATHKTRKCATLFKKYIQKKT